jgi:hypothetical protein
MKWSTKSISFEYFVSVIYRTIVKDDKFVRKRRVVINIRDLNAIIVFDVYLMSAQTNITIAITECAYISVVNALDYFYQWAIKFDDRHKLTVISHREQKQFNVCVMRYKNASSYVQRQTNLMLKDLRSFVRVYMNDIIIFFRTLDDHLEHLRSIFERFWHYNVTLNLKKIFLEHLSIVLLEQMIDVLNLTTAKKKLTTIANLAFSITLKKLKIYLELIDYMRICVSWYAQTSLLLQNRKTLLLKDDSLKEKQRRIFVKKKMLKLFIELEIRSYEHFQVVFSKKSFLRHFDELRKLFINVNISKKRDVEVMIFHVKSDSEKNITFKRTDIESIRFLSKILTSIETRYWSTELKMTDVVWMTRKVRHLIENSKKSSTIIFTDHVALANIVKQTFLTSVNTNKLNLRLVKVFQYLSILSIEIRVKSRKFHVILDALSRLFSVMNKNESQRNDEKEVLEDLNVMLIRSINEIKTSLFDIKFMRINEYLDVYFEQRESWIEITKTYRQSLLNVYDDDTQWSKLKFILKSRESFDDISDEMNFVLQNDFIYYSSERKTFKLCISWSLEKNIYEMTHDNNYHCEFHRVYARIFESVYIRHMIKRLRRYIHHCKLCLKDQIKRHSSYDELNSIRTMTFSFHTVIIDFVVTLSQVSSEENALLTSTDKFIKRVSLVLDRNTWNASNWATAWLNALQREDWELSKVIISSRDSKFVDFFWKAIFHHLRVVLHFITAYHFSSDDQSKWTNQTVEIVIRYALMKEINFIKVLSFIQSSLNNFANAFIDLSSNELLYEFKIAKSLNLLTRFDDDNLPTSIENEKEILKKKIEETIIFANAFMTIRYDSIRTSLDLKVEDSVYLKLHKEYSQSSLMNRKFAKQRLKSVRIIEKIDKLVYKLEISETWKIHSVISVIHLESASIEDDLYHREIKESESIKDAQRIIKNIYEIERILAKRSIKIERSRILKIQYKVKWKDWDDQHN